MPDENLNSENTPPILHVTLVNASDNSIASFDTTATTGQVLYALGEC